MAMTKKEQAEMEDLKRQLAIAKAFRFTNPVNKDVAPPSGGWGSTLSTGWVFNSYTKKVDVACSSQVHHAIGKTDKTSTQNPIWMFSSKLLALKALRHDLERKFAEELANIDKMIEIEEQHSEAEADPGKREG